MHRPEPEVYIVRASASMNVQFVPPRHHLKACRNPLSTCACKAYAASDSHGCRQSRSSDAVFGAGGAAAVMSGFCQLGMECAVL